MPNIARRERFISVAVSLVCIIVIPNAHAAAITLGSNNSRSLSISALKDVWISVGPIMIDSSVLRAGEFVSRFSHFFLPSQPNHFSFQFRVYSLMADSTYIGSVE
jgi:hypothetical protein